MTTGAQEDKGERERRSHAPEGLGGLWELLVGHERVDHVHVREPPDVAVVVDGWRMAWMAGHASSIGGTITTALPVRLPVSCFVF